MRRLSTTHSRVTAAPLVCLLWLLLTVCLVLPTLAAAATTSTTTTTTTTPNTKIKEEEKEDNTNNHHNNRPELVRNAIATNQPIYYFGLGSNMLREKLEQRTGFNITIRSMEAAIVPGHRLAFNMRGFPPLEPGMGSLEPTLKNTANNNNNDQTTTTTTTTTKTKSTTRSRPLLAYNKDECHGALVQLSAEDYEKVMRTEGIGPDVKKPGYEEVIVEAYPYPKNRNWNWNLRQRLTTTTTSTTPVLAVALRARPHVRLQQDPCPSQRYMDILRKGAKELQLVPQYQEFLKNHPVQQVSKALGKIAVYNLVFISILSFKLKVRFISRIQSWILYRISSLQHLPQQQQQQQQPQHGIGVIEHNNQDPNTTTTASSTSIISQFTRVSSQVAMGIVLFPGAIVGFGLLQVLRATGKLSPFMKQMVDRY